MFYLQLSTEKLACLRARRVTLTHLLSFVGGFCVELQVVIAVHLLLRQYVADWTWWVGIFAVEEDLTDRSGRVRVVTTLRLTWRAHAYETEDWTVYLPCLNWDRPASAAILCHHQRDQGKTNMFQLGNCKGVRFKRILKSQRQRKRRRKGKESIKGNGKQNFDRKKKSQTPQPWIEPRTHSKRGWCSTISYFLFSFTFPLKLSLRPFTQGKIFSPIRIFIYLWWLR